ncbi:MAG: hypothetical protein IT433_02280 [Phycisphaerales bacterium]|nr:hypothetical protein [Phycisphaerales bacterium]
MAETELDILMTRAIDGRASSTDWAEIERLGERDPGVWRDLATAQRDDASLRRAVALSLAGVDRVELAEAVHAHEATHAAHTMSRRTRAVATWAGWAAAAAVGLAFFTQQPRGDDTGRAMNPATAGVGAPQGQIESAADMLARYLDQGRQEGKVIQEVPEKWLLSAEPTGDGSRQQVIYLRLIMERAEVPEFYTFSQDEWGNPAPARIQIQTPQTQPAKRAVRPPV